MTSPPNYGDDAALARALQEEYEKEYRRRSMQQHLRNTNSGSTNQRAPPTRDAAPATNAQSRSRRELQPSAPRSSSAEPFHPYGASARPPAFAPYNYDQNSVDRTQEDSLGNIEMSDEAYARRLEQEMVEEAMAQRQQRILSEDRRSTSASRAPIPRGVAVPTTSSRAVARGPSNHDRTLNPSTYHGNNNNSVRSLTNHKANQPQGNRAMYPTAAAASAPSAYGYRYDTHAVSHDLPDYPDETARATIQNDAAFARRLEQEARDEELARHFVAQQQMQESSRAAQLAAARPAPKSCFRRCLSCTMTLILLTLAAFLVFFFIGGSSAVQDFIDDPTRFREEDPFSNSNPDDANLWRTRSNGLQLELINALDSDWHDFFDTAVSEWDAGIPDALTLTTSTATPDSTCRARDGAQKVCNGNYGETNWRGINKVMLENGWIYSSAARMNDYYVRENDVDQKQYTMCHEIGHGFGLPHSDENFFNRDLGNCMDYTNNPGNNKQPNIDNFNFLSDLYGSLDGSINPGDLSRETDVVTTTSAVPDTEVANNEQQGGGGGGGKNGKDRGGRKLNRVLPDSVLAALDELDSLVDNGLVGTSTDGWRVLHESSYAQAHEIDLGDGYAVQYHMLLAE